jgi:hypothetical protein
MEGYIVSSKSLDRLNTRARALDQNWAAQPRSFLLAFPHTYHTFLFLPILHTLETQTPPKSTLAPFEQPASCTAIITSIHVPVGATSTSRQATHNWITADGPDDSKYSPGDPLIPAALMTCSTVPVNDRAAFPSLPASSASSSMFPTPAPLIFRSLASLASSPFGEMGYKGRFNTPGPNHVVLESSDGHKFSISRRALTLAR